MSDFDADFQRNGFLGIPDILDQQELRRVRERLGRQAKLTVGDRRLLDHSWCRELAGSVRDELQSRRLIAGDYVATLCTYFDKSSDTNWGVAPHRDIGIPVRQEFDSNTWKNWTIKQGIPHGQPSKSFLRRMFAVRLNIDQSSSDNGALMVAPGSHLTDDQVQPQLMVEGPAGSALMMHPLIVHASRKSASGAHRRTLHFLFGPAVISLPAQWFYAA